MVLRDKEGSRWEAIRPYSHVSMVGELLGDILPTGQLDVCQVHAYSDNHQRAQHILSTFFSGLHPG